MCNTLLAQSLVLHPLAQSFKVVDEISVLCGLIFKRLNRETAEYSELKLSNLIPHLTSH